jgi:hypothetical protein
MMQGLGLDQRYLEDEDFSYALGTQGLTRKKLARAAGCILEYVGNVAIMVGTQDERDRCRDYLHWLLAQRVGDCVVTVTGRSDIISMTLEPHVCAYVIGAHGSNLRGLEEGRFSTKITRRRRLTPAQTRALSCSSTALAREAQVWRLTRPKNCSSVPRRRLVVNVPKTCSSAALTRRTAWCPQDPEMTITTVAGGATTNPGPAGEDVRAVHREEGRHHHHKEAEGVTVQGRTIAITVDEVRFGFLVFF